MWPKRKNPFTDPTSLGNLLVNNGVCSAADVKSALEDDRLLGETLVSMGKISRDDLEELLVRQRIARGDRNGSITQLADIALQRTRRAAQQLHEAHTLATVHVEKLK